MLTQSALAKHPLAYLCLHHKATAVPHALNEVEDINCLNIFDSLDLIGNSKKCSCATNTSTVRITENESISYLSKKVN